MPVRIPPPPSRDIDWPIPYEAVCLIAEFEGYSLTAYRCPAGVWTCGRGETQGVTAGTKWSPGYVEERFADSLREFAHEVQSLCRTAVPTGYQLGAMVALAYNIGIGAFGKSSVLKAHLRGDTQAASRAFGLFNKARVGGVLKVLPGLTRRRAAEAALYLKPDENQPDELPVQAVEPESRMVASPIANAGAAASGVGVLSLMGAAQEHVEAAKPLVSTGQQIMESVGIQPAYAAGVALIVIGVAIYYWRRKQRVDGWA